MAALVEVKDICKIYNPGENEVRALMAPYLDVDTVISNGEMYQVCGRKRA